ncbi:hypothetical protein VP1G_07521 [Cytospora mali]|uniref:SRR1-like domain-containing protein n=1 Tax=Cytospora mali TaxID=578113 RepID=A0A194V8V0_CYTMA|nr:hypothetical protein VP1G_07521 [Valsa mali var. pyri (nom. inval.)]
MDNISESDYTPPPEDELGLHLSAGIEYNDDLTPTELSAREVDARQVAGTVRELYTNGIPFFTRSAIRALVRQIDCATQLYQDEGASAINGQKFTIQAVDGKTVELDVQIGNTLPYSSTNQFIIGLVREDPFLSYHTYQRLATCYQDPPSFSPRLAYCSLRILYHARLRDLVTSQVVPPYKYKALEDVQEAFDAGVKTWGNSEDWRRLKSALAAVSLSKPITKIIAFACSTMSISDDSGSKRSILQHALMLTLRGFLQEKGVPGVEVQCYAQDPQYTEIDAAVLKRAGITVMRDPRCFLEVDESSVVLSVAPDIPVRQIVADLARPAILIWDRVKCEDKTLRIWSTRIPGRTWGNIEELEGILGDPDSPRLREMIRDEYIEVKELDEESFGQVSIYIRRQQAL